MAVTTYRCTGCKPIDTKIIEAYLALISTNESISAAESERERVSSEDHEASVLATQRANAAAEAAENAVANVGKFYGFYTSVSLLPSGATEAGYALVGETSPFEIWEFDGTSWSDSGTTMDAVQGESAYEVAVDNGYVGTEQQWLASLKGDTGDAAGFGTVQASVDANVGTPSVTVTTSGPDTAKNFNFAFSNMKGATGATGATPDFSIGTVTTGAAGSSASATITGTAAAPVLNLTIPQGATGNTGATGATGATPAFSIGEVTTGAAGSSASATITGTTAAPVLNLTIPKGDQGNTGSSVDYAYELVNNRTTNDATKGLSAAEGYRIGQDLDQLELEVNQMSALYKDTQTITGTDTIGVVYSGNKYYVATNSSGKILAFPVQAGKTYNIKLPIVATIPTLAALSFITGTYPASNDGFVDEVIKAVDATGNYETTYTPAANGTLLVLYQYNNVTYITTSGVQVKTASSYIDFQQEIDDLDADLQDIVSDISDLSDEVDGVEDEIAEIETAYKRPLPISGTLGIGLIYSGNSYYVPTNSSYRTLAFQVKNGIQYSIKAKVTTEATTIAAVSFYAGNALPTTDTFVDDMIRAISPVGDYELTYTPNADGFLIFVIGPTAQDYQSNIEVKEPGFVDFQTEIEGLSTELSGLEDKLDAEGVIETEGQSRVYNVTQGTALNTTSAGDRFFFDMPSGRTIYVKVNYPQGSTVDVIYFYRSNGTYQSYAYGKDNEFVQYVFDEDFVSFGFYIGAASATADGTAQVTIKVGSTISELSGRVDVLEQKVEQNRIRLADVLYHWLNGEKYPIGFHGDSTTDGVSTTGWTVENSHPAQDTAAGGTGKADYVCELAYPKQLQNLLRAELESSTLRVYNIGYYGASLANNKNQLEDIYSDAYADVKMVGIVLGINDRGTATDAADFYNDVVTLLVYYVEFFLEKGITPFMVTNQVVTQCGNDPNNSTYGALYQDYIQTLCNEAKRFVAKKYNLEIMEMNAFGRLLLESSDYAYDNITEDLHFKDLGHKLEAGYLFSEIIPWVNKTDDAKELYFGFNCAKCKTDFRIGWMKATTNDKFKIQVNTTQGTATDKCIFDAYMFNNSKNGAYNVTYVTPVASGYIVVDGDTANPISITSTSQNLGKWDIGLHHIQVYTGASTTVAFKGFILESEV